MYSVLLAFALALALSACDARSKEPAHPAHSSASREAPPPSAAPVVPAPVTPTTAPVTPTPRVTPTPNTARTDVPGTEISLELPPDVVLLPAGTMFANASGEVVIMVSVAGKGVEMEKEAVWLKAFPHEVESFLLAGTPATLYRRTRAEDGGGYDAWWLSVHAPDVTIAIEAMYRGSSKSAFAPLENVVRSVRWTSTKVATDVAFGYTLSSPAVVPTPSERSLTSTAVFTLQKVSPPAELSIMAFPLSAAERRQMFAGCTSGLMGDDVVGAPSLTHNAGLATCSAVKRYKADDNAQYVAHVETKEGGVLTFMGKTTGALKPALAEKFASTIKTLVRTR